MPGQMGMMNQMNGQMGPQHGQMGTGQMGHGGGMVGPRPSNPMSGPMAMSQQPSTSQAVGPGLVNLNTPGFVVCVQELWISFF